MQFGIAPKYGAEVLCSISQCKKAVVCHVEKVCGVEVEGCELIVNESCMHIKRSLNRNT